MAKSKKKFKFRVVRVWVVEATDALDATRKSKNIPHDKIMTTNIEWKEK